VADQEVRGQGEAENEHGRARRLHQPVEHQEKTRARVVDTAFGRIGNTRRYGHRASGALRTASTEVDEGAHDGQVEPSIRIETTGSTDRGGKHVRYSEDDRTAHHEAFARACLEVIAGRYGAPFHVAHLEGSAEASRFGRRWRRCLRRGWRRR